MSKILIGLVLAAVAVAGSACAVLPYGAYPGPAVHAPSDPVVVVPSPHVVYRPYPRRWY